MKTTLEWSVKFFWAMIGLYAITALGGTLWHLFFSHTGTRPEGILSWVLASVMLFLCVALILGAYHALFGFFSSVLQPTVLIVSLIMWCVAVQGDVHLIQPFLEHSAKSSGILSGFLLPIEGLWSLIIILVGAIGFYRALVRILPQLLFPSDSIRYSAARTF
jgi:hypothetical protein